MTIEQIILTIMISMGVNLVFLIIQELKEKD